MKRDDVLAVTPTIMLQRLKSGAPFIGSLALFLDAVSQEIAANEQPADS